MKNIPPYPIFVKVDRYTTFNGNCSCLRLRKCRHTGTYTYFRDGGHWDVKFKLDTKSGLLMSVSSVDSTNGLYMKECTFVEWKRSNGAHCASNRTIVTDIDLQIQADLLIGINGISDSVFSEMISNKKEINMSKSASLDGFHYTVEYLKGKSIAISCTTQAEWDACLPLVNGSRPGGISPSDWSSYKSNSTLYHDTDTNLSGLSSYGDLSYAKREGHLIISTETFLKSNSIGTVKPNVKYSIPNMVGAQITVCCPTYKEWEDCMSLLRKAGKSTLSEDNWRTYKDQSPCFTLCKDNRYHDTEFAHRGFYEREMYSIITSEEFIVSNELLADTISNSKFLIENFSKNNVLVHCTTESQYIEVIGMMKAAGHMWLGSGQSHNAWEYLKQDLCLGISRSGIHNTSIKNFNKYDTEYTLITYEQFINANCKKDEYIGDEETFDSLDEIDEPVDDAATSISSFFKDFDYRLLNKMDTSSPESILEDWQNKWKS